jgi:hypothetical protein
LHAVDWFHWGSWFLLSTDESELDITIKILRKILEGKLKLLDSSCFLDSE